MKDIVISPKHKDILLGIERRAVFAVVAWLVILLLQYQLLVKALGQ